MGGRLFSGAALPTLAQNRRTKWTPAMPDMAKPNLLSKAMQRVVQERLAPQ